MEDASKTNFWIMTEEEQDGQSKENRMSELPSDFSPEFVKLMKNRMETSYHKYGPAKLNRPVYDYVENIKKRLQKYEETHNTEWLADVANMAMLEWLLPIYQDAHFRPTDSHEAPKMKKFGD
jgi:hypothetical protein